MKASEVGYVLRKEVSKMRKLLPTAIVFLIMFAGLDSAWAHHAGNRPEDIGNINEEMVHGINYDDDDDIGGIGSGAPDEAGMPPIDDFGYPGEGELNQNYTDNGQPPDESIFYPVQMNCYIEMNEFEHMIANAAETDHLEFTYTYAPEPVTALLMAVGGLLLIRKR